MSLPLGLVLVAHLIMTALPANDGMVAISKPTVEEPGILVHEVQSPYQAGATQIRVLQPKTLVEGKRYPVIYVLPVEKGREKVYGDGLKEIAGLGLADKWGVIFVAPTFSHLPWYADHPSAKEIRQESYFVKVVVPTIEAQYPAQRDAKSRLLLGFSKSGWGAYSLLLRHPDLFGRAVAWDAPLMMDRPGKYGSGEIFGTDANFAKYRVSTLLADQAEPHQKEKRLILTGYGNFRGEHLAAHALMEKLKILHEYRDGPARKHDWHSGWVGEAVELLLTKAP